MFGLFYLYVVLFYIWCDALVFNQPDLKHRGKTRGNKMFNVTQFQWAIKMSHIIAFKLHYLDFRNIIKTLIVILDAETLF
jgi:hypothetical protein